MITVKNATLNLLRKLNVKIVVGNPGSTEETFLKDFPQDFEYIQVLQEASAVGVADGLSQGINTPVIVNVHTAAGLGNAMGNIITAYQNKTPLIITAGQQTREMLLLEPLLTNINSTMLPQPWVKWSYEPSRAEDVPAAFMRAYAMAMQQPCGPVFLSLPLDDWDKEVEELDYFRTISTRVAPDPKRVEFFANEINASKNPVIIYGADVSRSDAWLNAIEFAEKLGAKVWSAPFCERTPFPETHKQYMGALPAAIGPLCKLIDGHDLIIVIGAPVFRYYPYVPGSYIPNGSKLLQVTDDPSMASKAPVGDSLISDAKLFLESIVGRIDSKNINIEPKKQDDEIVVDEKESPLKPLTLYKILNDLTPKEYLVLFESPSNVPEFERVFKIDKPNMYYTFSSGALGWNMPAAVGLAKSEQLKGSNKPVIVMMGDGSFQYSIQSIYTGVRQNLQIIFIAFRNGEYGILKEFAVLEETPNVPGLDLPGLDIVSLSQGYGANAVRATNAAEIREAFKNALNFKGVSVIEVPTTKVNGSLL